MMLIKLFIISLVVVISNGLYLDVLIGSERCIGQELDQEDTATFKFSVANPELILPGVDKKKISNKNDMKVMITDPNGNTIYNEQVGTTDLEFKKNIEARGVYEVCFNLHHSKSQVIRAFVDIDFKSRVDHVKKTTDKSKKLTPQEIPTLEDELKVAEEILANIAREIEFARRQEVMLRQTGEKTQSRIQWFSALSIVVLVVTSLWQLIYLRKYFVDKKIL